MDLNLNGKRALVTGSTAGIGAEIARWLAREGVRVAIHGRDGRRAEQVAGSIRAEGGDAAVAIGDLSTEDGAAQASDAAVATLGGVDILVNNAGQYPWVGWWDSKPEDWTHVYETDVVSGVRLIQALVPAMRDRGWGRVIMLSSASGHHPPANQAPLYACAKAAQTHMAKCLAVELAGSGVTVNAVCPAPVATETTKVLFQDLAAKAGRSTEWSAVERDFVDSIMHDPPVRRMATTDEIAALVAYLASPLADPVTGAEHLIDCGFSVSGFRRQVNGRPADLPQGRQTLSAAE